MFISIPDSSATNNTGLLVNLFEMITSDILSLSSSFKRIAKLLILLFIFLYQRNLFRFNGIFFIKFFKIFFASIVMGVLFKYLIIIFEYQLVYSFDFKSLYLIISVFICVIFYLLFSLFIKAFKYEDINLKY